MSRFTLICCMMVASPLAVACDKSGMETQAKIDQATTTAATEVAEAGASAVIKMQGAESQAAKTIAAAQADFAATRENFRHKTQSDIDGLELRMDDLDAKAKTARGVAKTNLAATIPALRRQRDAFITDFHSIDNQSAATWDATRARIEKEWAELKAAVDKAA